MKERIKFRYTIADERAGSRDLPLLSVSARYGVVRRDLIADGPPRAEDLSNYKVCRPGDIVLNRMSAYQGAVGRSSEVGIVSPDYLVLTPSSRVESRYLHHLFRSKWFVGQMTSRLRGIGSSDNGGVRTPRINPEDLGDILVDFPDLDEQRRIAEFLDAETAKIDQLSTLRSHQDGQLDEREASWRSRLFLDSRSGTWVRVKHLLRAKPRYGVLVPEFVDDGVPFIRINNLSSFTGQDDLARIPQDLSVRYARTVTVLDDVLVGVVGSLGKAAVVSEELIGANVARAIAVLRLSPKYASSLFAVWIGTAEFMQQAQLATGSDTAQPTLGMEDLANFSLRWPADDAEQKLMTEAAKEHRLETAAIRAALDRQRTLVAERRQALITAAVTGQIDVTAARGVAV